MGLDDPFPLGEIEGVGTSYPGRTDYAIEIGVLTKQVKDMVQGVALNWLGIKKEDFI